MKRTNFYILLLSLLALSLFSCSTPAKPSQVTTLEVENQTPPTIEETDGITYEPLSDTTCKVVSYTGQSTDPVIPTKDENDRLVVEIGERAFANKEYLTSVTLPLSVRTISAEAFSGCTSLVTVDFPAHLVTIEENAFADCTSLTALELSASFESLSDTAFSGCSSLPRITVHKDNTAFAADGGILTSKDGQHLYLVAAAAGLTEFEADPSLRTVSAYAFAGNKTLERVTLGDAVSQVGAYAFSDCSALRELTLGAGLTEIPDGLCRRAKALTTLSMADGVTHIGTAAFDGCFALTDVSVPATVASVGMRAFAGTPWLTAAEEDFLIVGNGVLLHYSGDETDVILPAGVTYLSDAFHGSDITSVVLPDSLTHIGENAFRSCQHLQRITLPAGLREIGVSAFYGCTALTEVSGIGSLDTVSVATGNQSITKFFESEQ